MRHQVAVFIGEELIPLASGVKKYVLKYGKETSPYFNSMLFSQKNAEESLNIRKYIQAEKKSFSSDLEDEYQTTSSLLKSIACENFDLEVVDFFKSLKNEAITIENPGKYPELLISIFLPGYNPNLIDLAKRIVGILSEIQNEFTIDVISLTPDILRRIQDSKDFIDNSASYKSNYIASINDFMKFARSRTISHLIALDNRNANGLALDFNTDTLIRMIGEYLLLTTETYADVFNPNLNEKFSEKIITLGISSLYFDKYYFINYMLKKAYLEIIDRERVKESNVDVNWATKLSKDLIQKYVGMLGKFWQDKINPHLVDGESQENIASKVKTDIDKMYQDMEADLLSFISKNALSLPQKQAALAELSANDDELLQGSLFTNETFSIEDLDVEPTSFFIKESHRLPEDSPLRLNFLPVDEIKKLRNKIRQSTSYIRSKTEDLARLEKQIDNVEQSKKISEGSFTFGGVKYKLLDNSVVEQPLNETYEPLKTDIKSVDLSENFTPIKNQGSLGACTVFSLTSIYEYILKKNSNADSDLSEMFVYYNARKAEGKESEPAGTAFYQVIQTLQKEGICSEEFCKYDEAAYCDSPSQDAYADGLKKTVVSAMNVPLKIDAIRSALSEGYPIAMSFKIYDSFDAPKGFVQSPSEEELKTEGDGHAMVVVGYNDEHELLKVRNSWGKNFGDNGYCYIPYSWITTLNLVRSACIITKINQEIKVAGVKSFNSVDFDLTDASIKSFILKNLIDIEQQRLNKNKKLYAEKRREYELTNQLLGNDAQRKEIIEESLKTKEKELSASKSNRNKARSTWETTISNYESATKKIMIKTALYILLTVAALGFVWYEYIKYDLNNIFSSLTSDLGKSTAITVAVLIVVGIVVFYFILRYRKSKLKALKAEMREALDFLMKKEQKLKKEIDECRLKANIYSTAIDKLIVIQTKMTEKYRTVVSFVENLRIWRKEEELKQSEMTVESKSAFMSVLDNDKLDRYAELYISTITNDIHLYEYLMGDYSLDEESLLKFKQDIKEKLIKIFLEKCADFSVSKHIEGKVFDYADNQNRDKLIKRLQNYSIPFFKTKDILEMGSSLSIIFAENGNVGYGNYFSEKPSVIQRANANSVILMQQRYVNKDDLIL